MLFPSVELTRSSISFVCAADRQKRARDSMMGVAGNPTTTVARPWARHSLLNALKKSKLLFHYAFHSMNALNHALISFTVL